MRASSPRTTKAVSPTKASRMDWNEFRTWWSKQAFNAWNIYKTGGDPLASQRVGRGASPGRATSPTRATSPGRPVLGDLPSEILRDILIKIPYQDLVSKCRTSKSINEFCEDEVFLSEYAKEWGVPKRQAKSWREALKAHFNRRYLGPFEVINDRVKELRGLKFQSREGGGEVLDNGLAVLTKLLGRGIEGHTWYLMLPQDPTAVFLIYASKLDHGEAVVHSQIAALPGRVIGSTKALDYLAYYIKSLAEPPKYVSPTVPARA